MDIVDSLPFALTGGLFSRSPATIERVAARSPVGNLYVNRGITGAMVGRQPFGGNRRSGVGSKAGGPDYLLQFVEPRVVTENTMRHGIPQEGPRTPRACLLARLVRAGTAGTLTLTRVSPRGRSCRPWRLPPPVGRGSGARSLVEPRPAPVKAAVRESR